MKVKYGVSWNPRPIGYDLSGFVESIEDGEHLINLVKVVLRKNDIKTWLDYREYEPNWIQVKFQKEEFNLERLRELVMYNDNMITLAVLEQSKIKD